MVTSAKSMNDRPRFALRFISGKYQGGEFPLRMNREIIIGRSSDLDMVLVEDMVSRRHAKISSTEAEVYIQDMGSTNGTFVNGERITRKAIAEGDVAIICDHEVRFSFKAAGGPVTARRPESNGSANSVSARRKTR